MDLELVKKVESIFFPSRYRRMEAIKKSNEKFVHYTSADAAFKIIKNEEFWIRDSSCMNDYREISHGLDCLVESWKSDKAVAFKDVLEDCFPNIVKKIEKIFDEQFFYVERGTYIGSFSEHSEKENDFGRLSMWRAYGGDNPVALILNSHAFFNESDIFDGLFINPVDYHNESETEEKLNEIAANIKQEAEFVKSLGEEHTLDLVVYVLNFIITCTKHRGFGEEKEWRAIYCPELAASKVIEEDYVFVDSLPQKVFKIPLKNFPDYGVNSLQVPQLIDRVIIGPTRNHRIIYKTLLDVLRQAGVKNPHEKIITSDIPLKT